MGAQKLSKSVPAVELQQSMSLPAPFLRMGEWVMSWSTNWPKLITSRLLLWSGLSRSRVSRVETKRAEGSFLPELLALGAETPSA
jgi:hypothetical protein